MPIILLLGALLLAFRLFVRWFRSAAVPGAIAIVFAAIVLVNCVFVMAANSIRAYAIPTTAPGRDTGEGITSEYT
jgi:hypothetical protein